jgi:hypothetical protein
MNILFSELKNAHIEASLKELKSYYWLSTFLKDFINRCKCSCKDAFDESVLELQIILATNHIELNEEMKKCDICKILPCEMFSLLDVACRIDNQESMNSMYEELQYHVFLSWLYEEYNGKCMECDCFVEYISNLDQTCKFLESQDLKELQQYVYFWKLATNTDEIISQSDTLCINHHFYSEEIKNNDKMIIYLDFNVYGKYENDPTVKSYLDKILQDNKVSIFCSPVHLEELLRMNNQVYESKRICSLKKLTKGQSIIVNDEKLAFCVEDLNGRLNQVRKYTKLNNFAEERSCIRSESSEHLLNKYRNEALLKAIGTATFLKMVNNENNINGRKIDEKLPDESDINNILSYVGGSDNSIKEYHNLFKHKGLTFNTIRSAIASISSVFNVLGFHADKITRKNDPLARYPIYHKKSYRTIRSGYYDNDHLSFATKCKYFVTTDKKLLKKAKEIYDYIGSDTIPISLEEFMKKGC